MNDYIGNGESDYKKPEHMISRRAKADNLKNHAESKSIILIQAKAGQGKTVFAETIAGMFYDNTIYYRITDSDRDPVFFCGSLHSLFKSKYPKYRCVEFEQALKDGVESYETDFHIKNILRSLKKHLLKRTVIIFDDVHLLPDIGLACMTILTALTSSGGLLSFIICTRSNCVFPEKFAKLNRTAFRIDDDFLQVTESEFRELTVAYFDEMPSFSGLERIYRITEGWIAGILMIFRHMLLSEDRSALKDEDIPAVFGSYFQPLTEKYPQKYFRNIILLSLLDRFDSGFVSSLDITGKTLSVINDMLGKNVFTGISSDRLVSFHTIFKIWLKTTAGQIFTREEISAFYMAAYEYEHEKGRLIKALEYLICSGRNDDLEKFISCSYYSLISTDLSKSLYSVMSMLSAEILKNNPWTAVLYCNSQTYITMPKKTAILLHAYACFQKTGNKEGMLTTACGLIDIYCSADGDMEKGGIFYNTALTLADETPSYEHKQLHVSLSLGIGCLYLHSPEEAMNYLNTAMTLSEKLAVGNIKLRIYSAYCSAYIFMCDSVMAEKYCDAMIVKLNTSALNYSQKLAVMHQLVYYTAVSGKFSTMQVLLEVVKQKGRMHLELDSRINIFFALAEADYTLSNGLVEKTAMALNVFNESMLNIMPPHISSLFYGIKAIHAAYACDPSMGRFAQEAVERREKTETNPFFLSTAYYMAGAAYTLSGSHKKAENYLTKAIITGEQGANINAAAASYAYLSYLYNNIGDRLKAREYAVASLKMFNRTGVFHFIGLLPEATLNICSYAITDQATFTAATEIAYEKHDIAFDESGKYLPVLHIRALGTPAMSVGTKTMDCADISANFRTMLAILLSANEYVIEQESMQTYLWPDSSRDHARKSFDNLISRFRKMMADAFPGIDPKNYLTLQNGILRLQNVKSDADYFINYTKQAKEHYSRGEYTLAMETLVKAQDLFGSRFFANVTGVASVQQKSREIDAAFLSMLKLMQRLGFFLPDVFSPERFFDRWMDCYMSETDMVAMAYKYYNSRSRHQKCREIINTYRRFLHNDGYTEEEINDLIYMIKSSV
ncbi:MAG: hypothetical protein AB7E96_09005 [Deferribacterales bacterium]